MRLVRFIRAKETGIGKYRRPVKPFMPVGARTKVNPLVIPFVSLRMTTVVMNLSWREQQNITRSAGKFSSLVFHYALTANGEIENITFHSQRSVDKKIEITVGLNRR